MAFDPAQPFNDLPSLPPALEIETKPREKIFRHPALIEVLSK